MVAILTHYTSHAKKRETNDPHTSGIHASQESFASTGTELYGFLTPVENSKDEVKQVLNGKLTHFCRLMAV